MISAPLAALLLAAAAARPARAQQFSGIWELITPAPGPVAGPSGTYFGLPATTAGMFVVASSDASGANSTFAFDPTPMAWSEFPPSPGYTALQPVIVAVGGFLVSFSVGLLDDLRTISVIDSSQGQYATWTTIQLPPSSPNYPYRNGGRVALFGSILYRFGGCDMAGCHNDIWALDLSFVLASGFLSGSSPVGWVLVLPDQAAPIYPSKRRDGVLAIEGHTLILFGGYSADSGTYLNDLWFFQPGNVNGNLGPAPGNFAGSFYQSSTTAADPTDGIISPRAHSAHAVYGDNLFIFGGIATVAGADATMNDLWINRLPAQQWLKVGGNTAGQPWPMPLANSRPAGVIIGRWMYVLVVVDPAANAGATSQLWRWTFPIYPSGGGGGGQGGGGGGSNSGSNAQALAIATGHTAGIVVGLLIGLANLALLVAIYCGGAGSASFTATKLSATASGFYTSTPAGSSAGGYTAPADGLVA